MNGRVLKGTVVVDPADQLDESAVDEAVASAYERGFEEGAAAATAQLEAVVAELRDRLVETSAHAVDAIVAAHRVDAETVVALAADLVSWYLGQNTPEGHATDIDRAVAEALGSFEHETSLTLHVATDVAPHLHPPPTVEVVPDPALDATDFRLLASDGAVERSWADTIERLRPALVQAVTGATDAP